MNPSDKNRQNNWMHHPGLASMDQEKLKLLQNLAAQGGGKSQAELMGFLMNAAQQGKKSGLSFKPDEIDTIIQVLKMGKSPEETARLDKIISIMKMMNR